MDLLTQGILPECTLEQVELALELNMDDVEQTVSWIYEHPIDFHQLGSNAGDDADSASVSSEDGLGYEDVTSNGMRRWVPLAFFACRADVIC